MYYKYNAVLRSKTRNAYLMSTFKELCEGNTYVTTIHAINSAVIKLSKLTPAGKVYRGFCYGKLGKQCARCDVGSIARARTDLPCSTSLQPLSRALLHCRGIAVAATIAHRRFWKADSEGIRGGVEFGFSSTTREREQAVFYATGCEQAKKDDAMTIMEMQMGMIDRGAELVRHTVSILRPWVVLASVPSLLLPKGRTACGRNGSHNIRTSVRSCFRRSRVSRASPLMLTARC